jgi:hypothetical protein
MLKSTAGYVTVFLCAPPATPAALAALSALPARGGNVGEAAQCCNCHQYASCAAPPWHDVTKALSWPPPGFVLPRRVHMKSSDYFQAYRRMLATADDGIVDWWYSGWTFVRIEGQPEIPLMQITAIMTYRTETLAADRFRIHWSEIGVFRDPSTGEVPTEWVNPVTGAVVRPPVTFQEGPGSYTATATPNGVQLDIVQPNATVRSTQISFNVAFGRLAILQEERKQRGFPATDGKLPPPGSSAGFEGVTQLSFSASLADLARPAAQSLAVQGSYVFTLMGLVPWMGFGALTGRTITRGRITRAAPGHKLDALAWQRLAERFADEIASPTAARR